MIEKRGEEVGLWYDMTSSRESIKSIYNEEGRFRQQRGRIG